MSKLPESEMIERILILIEAVTLSNTEIVCSENTYEEGFRDGALSMLDAILLKLRQELP